MIGACQAILDGYAAIDANSRHSCIISSKIHIALNTSSIICAIIAIGHGLIAKDAFQ